MEPSSRRDLAPVDKEHRFVVIDTSALMDYPDLLQKQNANSNTNDILVVPYRVIEELDGLKTSKDETRASKARQANRQLGTNNTNNESPHIRYEGDHTILLPPEWDQTTKNDHIILSIALFFRLNNVLFVSSDKNLLTKARALKLNAQDAKSYMSSTVPHS